MNEKTAPEKRILCHVRACFDYDPHADNLNPCPEAGLAFERGDILGVLNRDDANWWQAVNVSYPSNDGAAKLIPSQVCQHLHTCIF